MEISVQNRVTLTEEKRQIIEQELRRVLTKDPAILHYVATNPTNNKTCILNFELPSHDYECAMLFDREKIHQLMRSTEDRHQKEHELCDLMCNSMPEPLRSTIWDTLHTGHVQDMTYNELEVAIQGFQD